MIKFAPDTEDEIRSMSIVLPGMQPNDLVELHDALWEILGVCIATEETKNSLSSSSFFYLTQLIRATSVVQERKEADDE